VRLWDVSAMDSGPACGWDDCRGGHFSHAGAVVAAVSTRQSRCSRRRIELLAGRVTCSEVSGKTKPGNQEAESYRVASGAAASWRVRILL